MKDLKHLFGDRHVKTTGLFKKRTFFNFSVGEVFGWHEKKGAIERLSPPWDPIGLLSVTDGINPGSKVALRMKVGPFAYRWVAEHTDYEKNRLFRDKQLRGPFAEWTHTHKFEPEGDGCVLEDRVEYKPRLSFVGSFLLDSFVRKKLSGIFAYRHRAAAADLEIHGMFADNPRKKILISGAGGLIGSKLVPFLTTGGHSVTRLTRRPPATEDEIFWDPEKGVLNPADIEGIDAVIHLAGESVGDSRWTKIKKSKIVNSRIMGTALLAETVSKLNPVPEVFISASATGYYGDGGEKTVVEKSASGEGFLADVCRRWENAVRPAAAGGIRTVIMRIGMVVTPEGGALKKFLLPFKLGLGGRIGSGRQFISWISLDDTLGAFYQALMNDNLSGPLNVAAPNPVSNCEFAQTLASVLSRPAVLTLPDPVIKLTFGQMGEEALLMGVRALPEKLLNSGFKFRHQKLEEALKHALGK